jgi:hypothetical protein
LIKNLATGTLDILRIISYNVHRIDKGKAGHGMTTKTNGSYRSNIEWFADVLGKDDVILCHASALECLQLFLGYVNERGIDVYAKSKGIYENINYRVVDSFDGPETVRVNGLRCTSVNRTVNDMLDDFDNADEQALVEALSDYYFIHNESFCGLAIEPRNAERFKKIRDWATEYHEVG